MFHMTRLRAALTALGFGLLLILSLNIIGAIAYSTIQSPNISVKVIVATGATRQRNDNAIYDVGGTPARFWHLADIGATRPMTGSYVHSALIDTGAECDLPWYHGRVQSGYDFVDGTGACHDGVGHGTNTAGDYLSVAGRSVVKEYKVFADDSSGASDSVVGLAVTQAVSDGNSIISLSLGGPAFDSGTQQAIAWACANRVLVFASSGNAGSWNGQDYPAGYPCVIRIAATDANGQRTIFSNASSNVAFGCPGADIRAVYPVYHTLIESEYQSYGYQTHLRGWATLSGTSMSSPICAAVAARLLAQGVSPEDALSDMRLTARYRQENREATGAGVPQVDAALAYAAAHHQFGEYSKSPTLSPLPQTITSHTPLPTNHRSYVLYNGHIL